MSIWDATRYGWNPIWFLTIEGVPVIWSEGRDGAALGQTLLAQFSTEAACLSIDKSGQIGTEKIDRERGIGSSSPMAFTLLDCDTVRTWLQRWAHSTTLTATASTTAGTLNVVDTTGFAATGAVWLGVERITYTGTTATSFTGCTRGQSAGFPYQHTYGTAGQIVTDAPRIWRGRQVTLWAKPVDQGGAIPGNALETDAVVVWRGRLIDGPNRQRDGFAFEAEQLDRVLERQLAAKVSGTVKEKGGKYTVNAGEQVSLTVRLLDAAGADVVGPYAITLQPWQGTGLVDGDPVSGAEIRKALVDAYAQWVADNTATGIGTMAWGQGNKSGGGKGQWYCSLSITFDALVEQVLVKTDYGSSFVMFPGGMQAAAYAATGWVTWDNPFDGADTPAAWGLTITLDEGTAADVPASGILSVDVKGLGPATVGYTVAATAGADLYLTTDGSAGLFPVNAPGLVGSSCEIIQTDSGTFNAMMLHTLESSGTAAERGTSDTLPENQGYGIDESLIAETTFADPLLEMLGKAAPNGGSFADMFGGALGLLRLAVVGKSTGTDWKLSLISTSPDGAPTADPITDADLLSHGGDPLASIAKLDAPNSVRVIMPFGPDVQDVLEMNSGGMQQVQGRRQVEFTVPADDRKKLMTLAKSIIKGQFAADQTGQAIELTVGPWVAAEPGDVVALTLTHPGLWTWGGGIGATGYTGTGRVVGRRMNPSTCIATLTILIDGATSVYSLSPAALVSAFGGIATAVTSLTVPLAYLTTMQAALAQSSPFWVQHYQPGSDADGQLHRVTAVAESGGACLLTVDTHTGGHTVVVGQSLLTWPKTSGSISTYQRYFAHVDDGSAWG